MLNNISWASYTYAIAIIIIIYYLFVLVVYYRSDISQLFLKRAAGLTGKSNLQQGTNREDINTITDGSLPAEGFGLTDHLSNLFYFIKEGGTRGYHREELLLSLQRYLQKDAALKDSIHQETINNFIVSECKNYCSMHLSDEEISALWKN